MMRHGKNSGGSLSYKKLVATEAFPGHICSHHKIQIASGHVTAIVECSLLTCHQGQHLFLLVLPCSCSTLSYQGSKSMISITLILQPTPQHCFGKPSIKEIQRDIASINYPLGSANHPPTLFSILVISRAEHGKASYHCFHYTHQGLGAPQLGIKKNTNTLRIIYESFPSGCASHFHVFQGQMEKCLPYKHYQEGILELFPVTSWKTHLHAALISPSYSQV